MDFDRLPNGILFQILQRLPFKERVRIACVNRRFKEVSELVISQTKAVCLTAPIFRNANAASMTKLFQLCAPNLKELICDFPHPTQDQYRSTMWYRLQIVTKFSHPRLEVLKVNNKRHNNAKVFQKLLAGLPNLRTVKWTYPPPKFPKVVCENLECITLRSCTIDFVASLADYCPNLKLVFLKGFPCNKKEQGLNEAFAKWPALETLELRPSGHGLQLEKIHSLWKLESLRTLLLDSDCRVTGQLLEKISVAFPLLERLGINIRHLVTSQSLAVLKNLKHLREVSLTEWGSDKIDTFAMELVSFEGLETVEIGGSHLSAATVNAFVHRCPKLRKFRIPGIKYVFTRRSARRFVRSLHGFVQDKLLFTVSHGRVRDWECRQVQSAVDQINKSTNGRQLSVCFDERIERILKLSPGINEWDTDPECQRAKEPINVPRNQLCGNRLTESVDG